MRVTPLHFRLWSYQMWCELLCVTATFVRLQNKAHFPLSKTTACSASRNEVTALGTENNRASMRGMWEVKLK